MTRRSGTRLPIRDTSNNTLKIVYSSAMKEQCPSFLIIICKPQFLSAFSHLVCNDDKNLMQHRQWIRPKSYHSFLGQRCPKCSSPFLQTFDISFRKVNNAKYECLNFIYHRHSMRLHIGMTLFPFQTEIHLETCQKVVPPHQPLSLFLTFCNETGKY